MKADVAEARRQAVREIVSVIDREVQAAEAAAREPGDVHERMLAKQRLEVWQRLQRSVVNEAHRLADQPVPATTEDG